MTPPYLAQNLTNHYIPQHEAPAATAVRRLT